MTTTQQTSLQLAARYLVQAQESSALLGRFLRSDHPKLADITDCLQDDLNNLGRALEAAGASAPTESYQGTPPPAPDSLEALRRIEQSRAQGEDLLLILANALPLAEALDKARGDWVGDMADTANGETPGTNYAETVQELLLRLQGELGAEGSGRE